jgi:hypothetical protein
MSALGSLADLRKSITRPLAYEGKSAPPRADFQINNLNVCFARKRSLKSPENHENEGRLTATSGPF